MTRDREIERLTDKDTDRLTEKQTDQAVLGVGLSLSPPGPYIFFLGDGGGDSTSLSRGCVGGLGRCSVSDVACGQVHSSD